MMITLRDRYRGAMVGVLAGDALGAPYETWDSARILADFEKRGGLVPFDYENPWVKEFPNLAGKVFPAGRPTDDSDHTAALAESLIASNGLNQEDLFNRLRCVVYDHVSPLWNGRAFGAGQTTRKVLKPETWEESKLLDMSNAYPSNGSLMRSVPLALYLGEYGRLPWRDAETAIKIKQMSEVTHRSTISITCCQAYISAVCALLTDEYKPSHAATIAQLDVFMDHCIEVDRVFARAWEKPADPGQWPERGAATLSLHAGLWAMLTASDFREGLTSVVSIGGDTDTNGAVAGGLLGVRFGIDAIPEEWQRVLKGRDKMIALADELYDSFAE